VDEALVSELEAALADVGTLLVRTRKYRLGAGEAAEALGREALALGDDARRRHRRGTLDASTTRPLLDAATALAGRLRALLQAAHDAPAYRRAVDAHAAGNQAALAATLPAVFAGLEPAGDAGDLFHALTWRRRGRPRPPADLASEARTILDAGIAAEGDDLSPGVDPGLPAVVLLTEPPADEPVVLRLSASTRNVPVYRLAETGEHLVYVARLRAPFRVAVQSALEADDTEGIADFDAYCAEVVAALRAAGIVPDGHA
jgi:hypothetical protein